MRKTLISLVAAMCLNTSLADDPQITGITYKANDIPTPTVTLTYTNLPSNTLWRVDYTTNLSSQVWSYYPIVIDANTTNRSVKVSAPGDQRFFRLHKYE